MTNMITRKKENTGGLVDGVFYNALNRFFDDRQWGFSGLTTNQQVPVNIRETDTSYELELVAPGLKKENFNVHVSNDMLTVSFEHKEEKQEKTESLLRQEYRMQSFTRNFNLDDTVDAGKIAAQYRDGILCISLPKKEGVQRTTKNIQIQ